MNSNLAISKLLMSVLKIRGCATLTVSGASMEPFLVEGDFVTIQAATEYNIGDVLVYEYLNEGLLIHRLVKKTSHYYCKGDNSFRLETIDFDKVIGKVVQINGATALEWETWKTNLSYEVSRCFARCYYNIEATKSTKTYRLYSNLLLKKDKVEYVKTSKLNFELTDKYAWIIRNSKNEIIYTTDAMGGEIINCLEIPCNIDMLLAKISKIYSRASEEMQDDVEEFLVDMVKSGVVEIL